MLKTEPDAIIHFAAESHVDRSNEPNSFIKTNIYGTAILEESMKYLKLKNKSFDSFRFIHVSTDEVFGSLGKKVAKKHPTTILVHHIQLQKKALII